MTRPECSLHLFSSYLLAPHADLCSQISFLFFSNSFIPRFFSGCKPSPLFPRQPRVFSPLAARTARLARRLALFEPTFSGVTTQPSQKLVSQIISRTRSPRILS